jgi:PIN domain nuclease of toxin-antitoxin system
MESQSSPEAGDEERPTTSAQAKPGSDIVAVLDASALLALLFDEPGADVVVDAIARGAAISAVNLSEVATVLTRRGIASDTILDPVREQVEVEPFSESDALFAATLHPNTADAGLSLGDRACLALARRLGVPALTADHVWAEVRLDVVVQVIRPHGP